MEVYSPSEIKKLLRQYEIAPLKQLGQNFLTDRSVLERIADAAKGESTAVLEIGPGLGALTSQLCRRFERTVCVEIDRGFVRVLGDTLGDANVEIVEGDILKTDLAALHEKLGGGSFCVCANLPYYITTPIIFFLLESGLPVERMVFLVQREVAARMTAEPGTKSYGALTVAVRSWANAETVMTVPPSCFYPAPDVTSAVVRLAPDSNAPVIGNRPLYMRLVRAAFAMRRKTLENNLVAGFSVSRETARSVIQSCGIPLGARGETLSPAQFSALCTELEKAL